MGACFEATGSAVHIEQAHHQTATEASDMKGPAVRMERAHIRTATGVVDLHPC